MSKYGVQTLRSHEEWPRVYKMMDRLRENMPFPKGGLEIIVQDPRRTDQQNKYLWGVVYATLAQGLSETHSTIIEPKHVHEICRQYFLEPEIVPGINKPVPRSTTKLTKSEFSDYVEQIKELAAKRSIYIPDAEEN